MSREAGPCPVCGQPVEVDQIEVTSWSDPPGTRRFLDGHASCPSGCNPADYPLISRAQWDAAVSAGPSPDRPDPEPVADFSPARMARAIDEAIRHNAGILERHRTEEDPFYWGDAMQWRPPQQEAS